MKNQPSNSTSCSDNALHLLVLVVGILYWGLQVMSSFSSWGCILKDHFGLFFSFFFFGGGGGLYNRLKSLGIFTLTMMNIIRKVDTASICTRQVSILSGSCVRRSRVVG